MKLHVGNLRYDTTEEDLRELFGTCGEVASVAMPVDSITGKIKGTAIVEMSTAAEADDAIERLHHASLHGQRIRVRLAEDHELAEVAQKLLVRGPEGGHPHGSDRPHRPERSPGR